MIGKLTAKRKSFLVIGILFMLFGLFMGVYIFRLRNAYEIKDLAVTIPTPSISFVSYIQGVSEAQSIQLPALPDTFAWQKTEMIPQFFEEAIEIVNNELDTSKRVKLAGTVWKFTKEGIPTNEDLNSETSWNVIIEYYQTELKKRGWEDNVTVGKSVINPVNADGDGASMMGFVGTKDGKLRGIFLVSSTTYASGEFPMDAACPCDQSFYIYESEETPLSEILL